VFEPSLFDFHLLLGQRGSICGLVSDGCELLEQLGRVSQALILDFGTAISNVVLVPRRQVEECLETLLVDSTGSLLLKLLEED